MDESWQLSMGCHKGNKLGNLMDFLNPLATGHIDVTIRDVDWKLSNTTYYKRPTKIFLSTVKS